jgi:hypothetical protein
MRKQQILKKQNYLNIQGAYNNIYFIEKMIGQLVDQIFQTTENKPFADML